MAYYAVVSDPEAELWNLLGLFISKAFCAGKLKEFRTSQGWALDPSIMDKKTAHVAICLQQGRQYMSAAKQVGLETRPIISYFGMVALAQAVILLRSEAKGLESLARAHGFKHRFGEDRRNLASLGFAFADDGTALELLDVAPADSFVLRAKLAPVGIVQDLQFTTPCDAAEARVKDWSILNDVAAYMPDVQPVFDALFPNLRRMYRGGVAVTVNTQSNQVLETAWLAADASQDLIDHLGVLKFTMTRAPGGGPWRLTRSFPIEQPLVFPGYVQPPGRVAYFFAEPSPYLAWPVRHLGAMFTLSVVARYRPHIWKRMIAAEEVLLGSFIRSVERSFANAVLSALWGDEVVLSATSQVLVPN